MTINQRVIIEDRDCTGQVTGTREGVFTGYDGSDLIIVLDSGKKTYKKESDVFESKEKYDRILANRNKAGLIKKEIDNYDWYEK